MATTIQISDETKRILDKMKMFARETYNQIIDRMIEDNQELNEKTKKEIEAAIKEIKAGKFVTQKEVEKKLGL